jgi:hypothetical protein
MTFTVGKAVIKRSEPGLPPFRSQIKNASAAVVRIGKAVIDGRPIWLTPAQSEQNRKICEGGCKYFRQRDRRCAHPDCGCFTRLKGRLATEDCPEGLFGPNAKSQTTQ